MNHVKCVYKYFFLAFYDVFENACDLRMKEKSRPIVTKSLFYCRDWRKRTSILSLLDKGSFDFNFCKRERETHLLLSEIIRHLISQEKCNIWNFYDDVKIQNAGVQKQIGSNEL